MSWKCFVNGKGAALASREFTIVIMSEGVSVQSTPCLPSLWHVASFSTRALL